MAVRQFDGVDDDIRHTVGSALADMEYGTFAALIKAQAPLDDFGTILSLVTSGNVLRVQWYYDDTTSWADLYVPDHTTEVDLPNYGNQWVLLVARKASGSVPVTYSLYRFNQGQWTHASSSNFADWTAPGANGQVRRSDDSGEQRFRGLIAVQAVWANRVPFASNTAVQDAGLHQSLDAWFDAEPDALWVFNQELATDPVDDLVGDAHQIAGVGTAVVTNDDPPGFDWGDEPEPPVGTEVLWDGTPVTWDGQPITWDSESVPEITATLPVEISLAGDAATPPATIPEVSAALDVAVDLAGAAETPAATIPQITSSLTIDVDLAGAAETPAATVPQITSSLAIDVDLAGAAETPSAEVPELTASLKLTVDLAGVAETPSAEVPELTASLNLAVDLAGVVATPSATVPEITSSLAIDVDLAGAAETPPDIPELEASLRIDLALDGELDVPSATVPELAGALAVEVAASGVLAHPAVEVPELAATLNMAVDLAGAVESPAATVSEVTSELAVAVAMAGVAADPVGRRYRELSLAASERTATVAAPSREVKVE